jgi:hypothetical protein
MSLDHNDFITGGLFVAMAVMSFFAIRGGIRWLKERKQQREADTIARTMRHRYMTGAQDGWHLAHRSHRDDIHAGHRN